jgi:prepilin-type N-terminal cleavage/methylation domain-containing protein
MTCEDDGFTLIEVLIAFAIMALAIVMAFGVFGDGLRGLQLAQERSHVIHVAQHQIDLASIAPNMREGTTLVIDESVKLRRVVQALTDFQGGQNFTLKPFKVSIFLDEPNGNSAPILETIIITKSSQP